MGPNLYFGLYFVMTHVRKKKLFRSNIQFGDNDKNQIKLCCVLSTNNKTNGKMWGLKLMKDENEIFNLIIIIHIYVCMLYRYQNNRNLSSNGENISTWDSVGTGIFEGSLDVVDNIQPSDWVIIPHSLLFALYRCCIVQQQGSITTLSWTKTHMKFIN